MKFRELGPQHSILKPAQDRVSSEFVKRHAALERAAALHHARTEASIRRPVSQRDQQVGQTFRGILTVTVQQGDEIKALLLRVMVTYLLVAAVALIDGIEQNSE